MTTSSSIRYLTPVLVLCLLSRHVGGVCDELYQAEYDSGTVAALECGPFPGDPTLHAIVYGCNSLNQGEQATPGTVSQSFTQICSAAISSDTNFTCYEMAADTDYTEFTNAVDYSIECVEGDASSIPIFQYQETVSSYLFGGGQGGQNTTGKAAEVFREDYASGVYFTTTVTAGEPLTPNPPGGAMANDTHTGDSMESQGGENQGSASESGSESGNESGTQGGDDSTSMSPIRHGSVFALLSLTFTCWMTVLF